MANDQEIRHRIQGTAEEVFDCWITPEAIEHWWGPDGFTTVVKELDCKEGGEFKYEMTAPDGTSCLMTGVFKTVCRPALLVFEMINHCNLGLPEGVTPQITPSLVTVNIVQHGDVAEVVMTHTSLEDSYSPLATMSWRQSLTKMTNYRANRGG